MVETQRHCFTIHTRYASRVTRVGNDDLLFSHVTNIGCAASALFLFYISTTVPLSNQSHNNLFQFLLANGTLHDEIHLVECLHQGFVVSLLFELFIEV